MPLYPTIDALSVLWFVGLFFVLPLLGWVALVIDLRAAYRRLRRALVVVNKYTLDVPMWALRDRPACLRELGLTPGCSRDEVMAAYRQRVKNVHPDRGGDRRRFDRLQQRLHEALRLVESRE